MLIPPALLHSLFDIAAQGVLHVGAHEAEEAEAYEALGWSPVIWVEMLPDKAAALRDRFAGDARNSLIEAAAWSSSGITRTLHEASNKQSSSLFAPQTHLTAHPEVSFSQRSIETRRLDELLDPAAPLDFLNLDVQGAEVEVMRGLGALLRRFRWVYLEVNLDALYADIPLRADVDRFMLRHGFTRVAEAIHADLGWGDALYVNGASFTPTEVFDLKRRGAAWQQERISAFDLAGDALVDMLRSRAALPAAP